MYRTADKRNERETTNNGVRASFVCAFQNDGIINLTQQEDSVLLRRAERRVGSVSVTTRSSDCMGSDETRKSDPTLAPVSGKGRRKETRV